MSTFDLTDYLKKKYPRTSSFLSGLALFFVDFFVLLFSIAFGFFIVNLIVPSNINFRSFINYVYFFPLILSVFACVGLYPGIMISNTEEVKKICGVTFFSFLAIILTIAVADIQESQLKEIIIRDSQNKALCAAFAIAFPVASILLPACRELFRHIFAKQKWWGVPAVIYCDDLSAEFIIEKLIKHPHLGYHPAIIVDSNCEEPIFYNGIPIYPPTQEILNVIKEYNIKTAVICDYHEDVTPIMASYRYTINVARNQAGFTSTQQLKDIAGVLAFSSIHNLTFKFNRFIKRTLDLSIILLASPFWLPIMLVLAFLTKVTSKGPVFYGHKRIGKNGKVMKCWKFRSMAIDADKQLEKILAENPEMRAEWEKERKFKNDPRVTKFGKILRKTSLDELPQLINIITGEMSLVGPRPVTEPELANYGKYKDFILTVPPGLSGMWQISGRSDTGYEERITYDTFYIQNWSIWLDIWILIKTVYVVLLEKGAY